MVEYCGARRGHQGGGEGAARGGRRRTRISLVFVGSTNTPMRTYAALLRIRNSFGGGTPIGRTEP
jgi:hypothetical protein